jgi:hypothetical protein
MAKHRSHSVAFKRQVAGEFIAGETLHALSKRHDISVGMFGSVQGLVALVVHQVDGAVATGLGTYVRALMRYA